MTKILIVTGDGGESYEALYAVHRMQEAGYEAIVAAPTKRRLHLVMHDFEEGWDTYVERPGYGLEADIAFDQVIAEEYDAMLLIGGRAPEYLRNNEKLLNLVREFHLLDRWLFAICHGIQILNAAGISAGRRLTCYEHVRNEVEQAGGTYVADQSARDGRIVTAQTWQSHPQFYRDVFACLTSPDSSKSQSKGAPAA